MRYTRRDGGDDVGRGPVPRRMWAHAGQRAGVALAVAEEASSSSQETTMLRQALYLRRLSPMREPGTAIAAAGACSTAQVFEGRAHCGR